MEKLEKIRTLKKELKESGHNQYISENQVEITRKIVVLSREYYQEYGHWPHEAGMLRKLHNL